VLAEYLRHYERQDQSDWDQWIPYAVYVYNTTVHTATECTSFELVYGFKSEVPSALTKSPSIQYNYDDYLADINGGCKRHIKLLGKNQHNRR
jgi:hypothetical protein